MTYSELENIRMSHNKEVCLFGGGVFGKTGGYHYVIALGFKVDFYCDNNIAPGTIIRDGIKVREIQYLYEHKDHILVFLTVDGRYRQSIINQLKEHSIDDIIVIDSLFISQLLDSIESSDDENIKQRYYSFYNDAAYLEKRFEYKTGYRLNLNNPKTFNEKLQWLKLYNHNPLYTTLVDKYAVKQYVTNVIGVQYVIPTLGIWNRYEDINFDILPEKFVLKCTHDSGSVIIVDNKNKIDYKYIKEKLNRALSINYYWMGREWPYRNVPRKIIAEKYMAESSQMIDYKFLCFNGNPRIVFTCTERFSSDGLKVTFFDLDWNRLDFERHYPSSKKKIERPYNLELMISLSEKLSKGIPFVRVDFYEIDGRVYFGEMTFFPGGGMEEFTPQIWDRELGDWIVLPKKE